MIKITFDYFAWLPSLHLTSRFDRIRRLKFKDLKTNDDIYQTAEEVGVKPSRIAFTNQEKKLKRYKNLKLYAIKYKNIYNNNNVCKNIYTI